MNALLLALTLVSVTWENDLPVPGGKDRWLTNRVEVQAGRWSIGNEMYTPDDLRSSEVPEGDAPWDGYTWIGYWLPIDAERSLEIRGGMVGGRESGTEWLQTTAHRDLGFGTTPMGWDTANPGEPAIDMIYSHHRGARFESWIGMVDLSQRYGARVGNVVVAAFLDQEVRKGFWGRGQGIYGVAGLTGELRGWNTHLQGRLFRSNTYTVEPIPMVATFRAGLGAAWAGWELNLIYKFTTEEWVGQPERHIYGSVQLARSW